MADSRFPASSAGRDGGLGRVRDGWDGVEAEETRLLRQMTVQESLRQLLALQRAFEPQLRQTET